MSASVSENICNPQDLAPLKIILHSRVSHDLAPLNVIFLF